MTASRFLLPVGALVLMGLISKGVASDATRRDRIGLEPSMESSACASPTVTPPAVELAFSDDESSATDDDLEGDSTVP
jgi:hypothetical protein